MNNLTIQEKNGALWAESREVAELVGKNHKDLMRDIRGYIAVLASAPEIGEVNGRKIAPVGIERKIAPNDFFLESTYMDSIGRTLPCFLISKKGCEMVANKLTGDKGVLFTAMMDTTGRTRPFLYMN